MSFNRRKFITYTLLCSGAAALPEIIFPVSIAEAAINPRQAKITTSNRQISAATRLTSAFRKKHGLNSITHNSVLQKLAEAQALAMAKSGKVSHSIGFGNSFARRLNRSSYQARTAAENIAGGYTTIEKAMVGWQNSSGHRKNLLKSGIQEIGLGVAVNPTTRLKIYWAMVFASPYP